MYKDKNSLKVLFLEIFLEHWREPDILLCLQILVDQTNFLVVGIVGPQGVGKSTILSMLAGTSPFTDSRLVINSKSQ